MHQECKYLILNKFSMRVLLYIRIGGYMKRKPNGIGHVLGVMGIITVLSSSAVANNIMPIFNSVTPTPNPSGWGVSGAILGIDIYSLDKIDGFEGRDNVLEVIVPAGSNLLQTVGGEHAVTGGVDSQLEAYLWVPGSWRDDPNLIGKVDTDMLGIMPLSMLPDLPPDDDHPDPWKPDYSYFPAIGFSNESGTGTFKVWDSSRTSPEDPTPNYTCGYPTFPTCWVKLDGTATDRGGSSVPNAPVLYGAWNKLTIDFTPDFNIVYSVNDVPVYTGIMDILGLWDPADVTAFYGFTATQMRGLYLGADYVANWSVDEPTTLMLTVIGLGLLGMGRMRQHRNNAV